MISDVLDAMVRTATFIPHGYCLAWRPDLLALHGGSDLVTAASYFAIPLAIHRFAQARTDLQPEHRRTAVLFVAFILACGFTHLFSFVTLWVPAYGAQGLLKAATAAVSAVTAFLLFPLGRQLLKVPSAVEIGRANDALRAEIEAHRNTLEQLRAAKADLEARVQDRTAALSRITERFAAALERTEVVIFEQDADLRYTWIANPALGMRDEEVIGRSDHDILPPAAADQLSALKKAVLLSGEPRRAEIKISEEVWFEIGVRRFETPQGLGVLCAAVDVSRHKAQADRMRIVMRELTHRTKNLFAVVTAIARQTSTSLGVTDEFNRRFVARLNALARAHDLLVSSEWRSADLGELAVAQMAAIEPEASRAVEIDGPPVALPPQAAQMTALALHELATNALKHGALAQAGGTVRLSWTLNEDGLRVVWRERLPQPTLAPPERGGFGRLLLERLVPQALGATGRLEFHPDGVAWELHAAALAREDPDGPLGGALPAGGGAA